ncbi:hypothetical protein SCHPADRAFT_947314 [Schizopora paradoxa]|uniref:Uncharacterized protein n=1 Tax=Schizopora paradoxa TaxID=27342 RepID=A0A0H2RJL2_9AGAM|nr:hypothetical protein SCHPADRAFT_947314 [Schizopora paradoxa]
MPRRPSNTTFRLVLETFDEVKTQLVGLTEEAKTISRSVDDMKTSVQKKRKEVQQLVKKVAGRRKTLLALKKKSRKAGAEAAPGSSVDVNNTTFVIEEVNVSAAVVDSEAPSARKRKRFAGIWNAPSISADSLIALEGKAKRPRRGADESEKPLVESETSWTSTTGVENDENLAPAGQSSRC